MEISDFLANYVILTAILNFLNLSGIKRHRSDASKIYSAEKKQKVW